MYVSLKTISKSDLCTLLKQYYPKKHHDRLDDFFGGTSKLNDIYTSYKDYTFHIGSSIRSSFKPPGIEYFDGTEQVLSLLNHRSASIIRRINGKSINT
jgi:hypothetical protein